MALTGSFEDIGFAELLQLLNIGHRSGRLQVWRGTERAELFIRHGEVARARSRMESGPEVVYRVLGWKTGEFSFARTDHAVVREIMQSTEALILEGMKRFDEWEHVEAEGPNMQVVLRQQVSAVNERYETLSPEAQTVLRLVDARRTVAILVRESGLEPAEALAAVAELVTEGVVEEWSEPPEASDVLRARGRLPEAQGDLDFPSVTRIAWPGGRPPRPQGAGDTPREATMGTSRATRQGVGRR
jgi:hypothetical protein